MNLVKSSSLYSFDLKPSFRESSEFTLLSLIYHSPSYHQSALLMCYITWLHLRGFLLQTLSSIVLTFLPTQSPPTLRTSRVHSRSLSKNFIPKKISYPPQHPKNPHPTTPPYNHQLNVSIHNPQVRLRPQKGSAMGSMQRSSRQMLQPRLP